jgi:hypothetical protein
MDLVEEVTEDALGSSKETDLVEEAADIVCDWL